MVVVLPKEVEGYRCNDKLLSTLDYMVSSMVPVRWRVRIGIPQVPGVAWLRRRLNWPEVWHFSLWEL